MEEEHPDASLGQDPFGCSDGENLVCGMDLASSPGSGSVREPKLPWEFKHEAPEVSCTSHGLLNLVGICFPWVLCMLIGVLTALTGSYISVNCDFLSDLRFGFCRGMYFADRKRCCGGAQNINVLHGICVRPGIVTPGVEAAEVEWVPWEKYFGISLLESWAGYVLSFFLYVLPSLVWSGLAVFLVTEYCPAARGSGIPEVKAAVSGFDLPSHLSGWCLLIKTLGLSLVVGAGLSLGKEGPLIHIGACWARLIKDLVAHPLEQLGLPGESMSLHELACVGSAAGVSTAFGAPIGGVLFAVEELGSMRELSPRTLLYAFMAAFLASFTLKHLNLSGENQLTLFALSVPTHDAKKEWIAWEMVAFLFVGVCGGLVGAFFIKLNLHITKLRRKRLKAGRLWFLPRGFQARCLDPWIGGGSEAGVSTRALSVVEGIMIAFVTALLNYPFTVLLRNLAPEAIHALFETCPQPRAVHFGLCAAETEGRPNMSDSVSHSLLLAAAVRIFETSYTFGAPVPSGLFIPSLFIGATIGRFIGNAMLLFNGQLTTHRWVVIDPGVFAMVGAVASLSGFCRMTVSLVVIMFELTGELTYVVPFMCAVLTAKIVGDSFTPSIYDAHAKLNEYPPVEELKDLRLEMLVSDIAQALNQESILVDSEPLSLKQLEAASRSPEHREAAPEVLLLLRSGESVQHLALPDRISGIVECDQLRWWLDTHGRRGGPDTPCTFMRTYSSRPSSPEAAVIGVPSAVDEEAAAADGDPDGTDAANGDLRRVSSPFGDVVGAAATEADRDRTMRRNGSPMDLCGLIDTTVARLSAQAPLLTAQCLFEQKLDVRYCVCMDEHHETDHEVTFSVLSRETLYEALSEGQFSLGHEPTVGFRTVGAAAAMGIAWRGRNAHPEVAALAA